MSAYTDSHRYEERLEATLGRIARDPKISTPDRKLILDFIEHSKAQGSGAGRRFKLAWSLQSIARQMPCSFKTAKRKQIEKVVAWVNSADKYSANT